MHLSKRIKFTLFLGNLFEHYDTALFALLSPFFAPLFFPKQDPIVALALTYAIIPLSMLARPLGSLIFGYIGDKHGRNEALTISLVGMAFITGCISLMPTYESVGFIAPILLSLGRFLQNFFSAGESIGGAIYLMESSMEQNHNKLSGYFSASTIAGILAASGAVSILCSLNKVEEYWRILYCIGCATAIFGGILRIKCKPLDFLRKELSFKNSVRSSLQTCWEYRSKVLIIATVSGFSYATYILALVIINGLLPLVSKLSQEETLYLNTIILVVDFSLLLFYGMFAEKFPRDKMMLFSAGLWILTSIPLFTLLDGASFTTVVFIRLWLVFLGVWFAAPFHAWSQQIIPAAQRYTVISFAYALGTQILGAPTAVISLWLFNQTGLTGSVAWYGIVLASLSGFFILKQKFWFDLETNPFKRNVETTS